MYNLPSTPHRLIPHSDCGERDLQAEYQSERGVAALSLEKLLKITVPTGTQPCNFFGIHPSLPTLKRLYVDCIWREGKNENRQKRMV